MRKLISVFLICICLSVYSQNEFADIQAEVNSWDSSIEYASVITNKTPKFIDFTTHHYSISGILAKGILCEGTTVKFYDTASLVPYLLWRVECHIKLADWLSLEPDILRL